MLTSRSRYGACDLVPFLRRDAGEDATLIEWEKPAAAVALHGRGWSVHRVARAVGLSHETVQEVLEGRYRPAPVANARSLMETSRRESRRAERIMVEGRWVHPDAPHGEPSSYKNWCCRCVPCGEAHRVEQRARRARKRAEA